MIIIKVFILSEKGRVKAPIERHKPRHRKRIKRTQNTLHCGINDKDLRTTLSLKFRVD